MKSLISAIILSMHLGATDYLLVGNSNECFASNQSAGLSKIQGEFKGYYCHVYVKENQCVLTGISYTNTAESFYMNGIGTLIRIIPREKSSAGFYCYNRER